MRSGQLTRARAERAIAGVLESLARREAKPQIPAVLGISPRFASIVAPVAVLLLGGASIWFVPPDIVFVGDSITANWTKVCPDSWSRRWINKGVAGENSNQVAARFERDVLALHPRVVHILVGINDIGGVNGHLSLAATEANITAMASAASDHNIHVVIGTIEPIPDRAWKSKPEEGGQPQIDRLNAWIRNYAASSGADVADYAGWIRPDMTSDGVHPNQEGYGRMALVAHDALAGGHKLPPPEYGTPLPSG